MDIFGLSVAAILAARAEYARKVDGGQSTQSNEDVLKS